METENLYTIYFSPTGTSHKIAEAIAQGFAEESGLCTTTVDLTHLSGTVPVFARNAAAVIAVPVYGGKVAPVARKRLEALRAEGTLALLVVLYGNRAFESALSELAEIAAAQGFVPIAAAAFVGEHSYSTEYHPIAAGRPGPNDLAQATAFGRRTAEWLEKEKGEMPPRKTALDVRKIAHPSSGLWPMVRFIRFVLGYRRSQKRRPAVYLPATNPVACIHCGLCADLCPVDAIVKGDEERTDPARCIRCCACVKGCPVRARTFETPFAAALSRNFRRQKPNVFLPPMDDLN